MSPDCQSFQENFGLLRSGELSADAAKRLEIHVASCDDCRAARTRDEALDAKLGAFLAPVAVPSRDEIQLMALRARATVRRDHKIRRLMAVAAVLVTLLIPAAAYFTFPPAQGATTVAFDGLGGTEEADF
jgi:anti-sigma factor RsiW